MLRKANDDYRKAIYNAQIYANTGAGTYEKAVDMATKDMLSRGLNCVMYANGARHTLSDYADMAIRTASKRGLRALSAFPSSARYLSMMCGAAAVRTAWIQRPGNAIRL